MPSVDVATDWSAMDRPTFLRLPVRRLVWEQIDDALRAEVKGEMVAYYTRTIAELREIVSGLDLPPLSAVERIAKLERMLAVAEALS